jgi:signal transduction histidine kinase/ActR/RegA family two-component response regulator
MAQSNPVCSISGLPIRRDPAWVDIELGPDFTDNLLVLGDRILVSRPRGFAEIEVLKQILRLTGKAAASVIGDQPFIWIADYSQLRGTTRAGRRCFVETIRRWQHLHTMIFCGLSPLLKANVKLGMRLGLVDFDVHVVETYPDALTLATRILKDLTQEQEVETVAPSATITSDSWQLQEERFSIRLEVIDGDTLHSSASGVFDEGHVEKVFEVQERALQESGLARRSSYYIISGLDRLASISFKARRLYFKCIESWYRQHPFKLMLFYGTNRTMRAAINVTRPFASFNARIVPDLASARRLIDGLRSSSLELPDSGTAFSESDQLEMYVEELLQEIAQISWDDEVPITEPDYGPEHPFNPVFEAIRYIRTEIQELQQEQNQAEEERRKLQDKLARSRKMEALGLLAGGVAHELNNILSGIMTYPELLLMDENLDPRMKKAIETIRQSGQLAAEVVNDLVTIARGGAGARVPLSLNEIVRESLHSPEIRNLCQLFPSVTIETRLADALPPILGSPVHIRKVVMNLISNAVEAFYGESQGGTVKVRTSLRYLDVPVRGYDDVREGEYSVLSVADDGIGIGSEDIERIFEPFYSKKVIGRSGSGLGLTVVWNTVQEHFGYIDISSSDDGTLFDLFFPVTGEQVAEPEATISVADYRGNGESVLVIDDAETQRQIACSLLEALGYQAESAASGEEAVEILKEKSFDLILLDMIMDPGINGRETYERILEIHPGQKAVIASGFSETDDVRIAQQLGAGPFIMKPYTLAKIGLAIRDELQHGT